MDIFILTMFASWKVISSSLSIHLPNFMCSINKRQHVWCNGLSKLLKHDRYSSEVTERLTRYVQLKLSDANDFSPLAETHSVLIKWLYNRNVYM